MSNALEYVLGCSKLLTDQSKLPVLSLAGGNMIFTFQRAQASIDGSTTIVVEAGPDLTT